MKTMTRAREAWLSLLGVLLLCGCGGHMFEDFVYSPHRFRQAQPTRIKIAIMPFEDLRETRRSGDLGWANMPVVPYAHRTEDRRQATDERFQSDYYLPDLLAHMIAVELVFNEGVRGSISRHWRWKTTT